MSQKNILVPELPESIHNATIVNWHKNIGDYVKQDEILLEIETEKVILEIPSISNGILIEILYESGSIVHSKQIIGKIKEKNIDNISKKNNKNITIDKKKDINSTVDILNNNIQHSSPSIRRNIFKKNIQHKNSININDKNKNIDKLINNYDSENEYHVLEKRIPMNFIRKKTAEKLLHTVQNTAMLTTFNEVNMQSIIKIRKKYSIAFESKHNIKLGLTSFFIKAAVESLKTFPEINSKIDKNDIIYYKYYNINIAISTKYGLIAPVLKNVNNMSISTIEKKIQYFLLKGNSGKLKLEDLIGGNFTITNGGVFGSLLSTPMINFPQTAILGIHAIQNRAVVINNEIKISPMMYIALSYDHRLIDGKEAIGFLKNVKNILEDPSRILLEI